MSKMEQIWKSLDCYCYTEFNNAVFEYGLALQKDCIQFLLEKYQTISTIFHYARMFNKELYEWNFDNKIDLDALLVECEKRELNAKAI